MGVMTENTWQRHSNPLSVWSRVLTNPLVYVPIWNRSWSQAAPVGLWFALNPILFRPPKDDSAWATRAVLGEQIWVKDPKAGLPTALNTASGVCFAVALLAAYRRRLPVLLTWGALALVSKMVFLVRMVALYDTHDANSELRPETGA
jgi:hypothetical protein